MFYMDIKDMKYILTIVEEGNLTKAAEKLYTTQPNLTRSVNKTEEIIGLPLFDKTKTPWALTYTGNLYVKTAMKMLKANEEFVKQTKNIINGQQGIIKIGVMDIEERYLLPRILPIIKSHFPELTIEVIRIAPLDADMMLVNNLVDFAFLVLGENEEIEYIPVKKYDILLAVPCNHKLAYDYVYPEDKKNFPEIDLNLLRKESFVVVNNSLSGKYVRDSICNKYGFDLNIEFTVLTSDAAVATVEAGYGMTFVLDQHVIERWHSKKAVYFKVVDNPFQQEIGFAYKKNKTFNSLEKKFLEVIKNINFNSI